MNPFLFGALVFGCIWVGLFVASFFIPDDVCYDDEDFYL